MQSNGQQDNVTSFARIIDDMFDLYAKKNANYGNSFSQLWDTLGPVAGLVPLHNKLNRATNLVTGGTNNFESLEDTFIDLANYAIMNVIELRRTCTQTAIEDMIPELASINKEN